MKTRIATVLLLLLVVGCGPAELTAGAPDESIDAAASSSVATAGSQLRLPSEDRSDTVDVGSWNVEWFGSTRAGQGPTNEALQQANVTRVLKDTNLDLVGLVEVVSEQAFAGVVSQLPEHDGLVVTDPRVVGGSTYYSPSEQKVALVFRKRFTVESARVVMTESAFAFGGRPPMEVHLSFLEGGKPRALVVLVAHFKAMANADGYARRVEAAAALKAFLDAEYPRKWVLVVGDFNDDLVTSTYRGHESPFVTLAHDAAYRFTTDALSATHQPTTVAFSSTIDHHLATDDLATRFVEGSAKVLHPETFIAAYGTSTSDHYPVLTRYDVR